MTGPASDSIQRLMASNDPTEMRQGLDLVRQEIVRVGSRDARPLFEMVSALFYIDPLDRPDLLPLIDDAVSLVVGFGDWVIAALIDHMDLGDLKAQLAIANALGRMGAEAVEPLLAAYASSADDTMRVFLLYALGKVKSPKVAAAIPVALEAARSPVTETRDTGARALGNMVESVPVEALTGDLRRQILECVKVNLADANPGIRAKAMRSYGKLALYGYLGRDERRELRATCARILGTDDAYAWDRAFIVRKEAEEALRHALRYVPYPLATTREPGLPWAPAGSLPSRGPVASPI